MWRRSWPFSRPPKRITSPARPSMCPRVTDCSGQQEAIMTLEERRRRGAKLIEQMLGKEQARKTRATWRKISPDFEHYVTEFLAGEIWSRKQLDLRIKSLITVAALA